MYSKSENFANLCTAARENDVDRVSDLMWACNPKNANSKPLRCAAAAGSLEALNALISVSDVHAAEALILASEFGHLPCVERLVRLTVLPLNNNGVKALTLAALGGHHEVVEFLLTCAIDPKAQDSRALAAAAHGQHQDIVDLLLPVSCVPSALKFLNAQKHPKHVYDWLEQYAHAQQQKKTLLENLSTKYSEEYAILARKM